VTFISWGVWVPDPEEDDFSGEACPQCGMHDAYPDTNEFGDGEPGDDVLLYRCGSCGHTWCEPVLDYEPHAEIELSNF
jgi:hypothetical protein